MFRRIPDGLSRAPWRPQEPSPAPNSVADGRAQRRSRYGTWSEQALAHGRAGPSTSEHVVGLGSAAPVVWGRHPHPDGTGSPTRAGESVCPSRSMTIPVEITFKVILNRRWGDSDVVPELGGGLLGCLRCGYVWRLRKSPVHICPRCKSRHWDELRTAPLAFVHRRRGLGVQDVIGSSAEALKALAAEYGGYNLRIFGSVARGDARTDSDVDLLVQFRHPPGLLARAELKERAQRLLGRTVDLATESNLHWLVRPQVLAEARAL